MTARQKQIPLGGLEPEEYEMLREALAYAVEYCEIKAFTEADAKKLWDRASEFRALRARFGKRGRK